MRLHFSSSGSWSRRKERGRLSTVGRVPPVARHPGSERNCCHMYRSVGTPVTVCLSLEDSARKNHQWRSIFRPGYQDVGVAEARIDLRALVFDAEPGERTVVERQDLGFASGAPIDGRGHHVLSGFIGTCVPARC